MNCQPITLTFHPRYFVEVDYGDVEIAEGRYANTYVPAITPSEIDQRSGQMIDDAKAAFLAYKDTEQGIDVYAW